MKLQPPLLVFLLTMAVIVTAVLPSFAVENDAPAAAKAAVKIDADQTTVTIDGEEYKVIRSASELDAIADGTSGTRFVLGNDIDCSGLTLRVEDGYYYLFALPVNTVLDGNGYAFTNVKISVKANSGTFVGSLSIFKLPKGVANSTTVRNLSVGSQKQPAIVTKEGGTADDAKSNAGVAVLFARAEFTGNLTLENIDVYATLTTAKDNYAGMLVGHIPTFGGGKLLVKNCAVNGAVKTVNGERAGGLFGFIQGNTLMQFENVVNCADVEPAGVRCGGLIGELNYNEANGDNTLQMTDCKNYGSVSGTWCGGFIGMANGNGTNAVPFKNCVNYGNVTGQETGGMVGVRCGVGMKFQFYDCANCGDLNGSEDCGGAIGWCEEKSGAKVIEFMRSWLNSGSISGKNVSATIGRMRNHLTGDTKDGVKCVMLNIGTVAGTKTGPKGALFPADYDEKNNVVRADIAYDLVEYLKTEGNTVGAFVEELNSDADARRAWDGFVLSNDGAKVVFATPVFAGAQIGKNAENNTASVRLVATIGDSLRYSSVGFVLHRVGSEKDPVKKSFTTVYGSILADNGAETIAAADLGGTYIFALTITGVPTNETVTYEVSAIATGEDGTTEYTTDVYCVTVENGEITEVKKIK